MVTILLIDVVSLCSKINLLLKKNNFEKLLANPIFLSRHRKHLQKKTEYILTLREAICKNRAFDDTEGKFFVSDLDAISCTGY